MKKFIGAAMLAGVAVAGTSGVANADPTVTANVAFTSDYVWRGLSQSDNDFAVQGGADFSDGIFYAGTWASNVDFGTGGANAELDLYGGIKPVTGPVSWDFGVIGYFYPGSTDAGGDLDYYELKGAATVPFGPLSLTGSVYWTDDFGTFDENGLYVEAKGSYAVNDKFSINASYGSQNVDNVGSYANWKVDGSYTFGGFGWDLAYTDTSNGEEFGADTYGDSKVVLTISKAL
ncbi:MAG: TorF family putative porin [Pseudomonadota bacterium]